MKLKLYYRLMNAADWLYYLKVTPPRKVQYAARDAAMFFCDKIEKMEKGDA